MRKSANECFGTLLVPTRGALAPCYSPSVVSASPLPRSLLEIQIKVPTPGPVNQSLYFNKIPRLFVCILKLEKPCPSLLCTWVLFLFLSMCFQNVCLSSSKMYPHIVNTVFSKYSLGKELTTAVNKVNEKCIFLKPKYR